MEYSQLVIMLTMLLPGTNVVYYGNEIGLDSVNIKCADSQDPYALAECENLNGEDFPKVSRDPGRTPMQVCAPVFTATIQAYSDTWVGWTWIWDVAPARLVSR